MTERQSHIHVARVYLTESHRRGRDPFAFTLLQWAANARRRAMAAPANEQLDLFGGTA